MTPALEARNVTKSFGADGVLAGVDLAVEEGELLVLLGPNGVGKTVLLTCLAGSSAPTEGEVTVFGDPVAEDRGERLSFLLQGSMCSATLSGRENAEFYERLHPAFTDRWREYVERLGVAGDLDRRVGDYSAGMTRKLELSLALSIDVPVYLLDEPTAGVDLTMIGEFHDIITDLHDRGRTFVVTSHRPMDADLADRLAVIREDGVAATGTPDDLLADVPPVVRVDGTSAVDAAEPHVRESQLFPAGGEFRGFLRESASVANVEAAVSDAGASATVTDPTYADLFNYYVHVI
ncbi:MAG: ABC transporter ATP-binding protein [Haloarculaceae archaeon]